MGDNNLYAKVSGLF